MECACVWKLTRRLCLLSVHLEYQTWFGRIKVLTDILKQFELWLDISAVKEIIWTKNCLHLVPLMSDSQGMDGSAIDRKCNIMNSDRKHHITTELGDFSPSSRDFDRFLTILGNFSCSNRSWKSFNYFRIIFSLKKAVDCAIFHIFPDFFKGWPNFWGYIFPDHWLGEIGSWIFTQ